MNHVRTLCAAVACAAALLAPPAAYASSALVALQDLKITLVDLDESDGVLPSVLQGQAMGRSDLQHCFDGVCNWWPDARPYIGIPLFLAGEPALVDGSKFFAPDAFGATAADGSGFQGDLGAGFWETHGWGGSFGISAKTRIVITGNLVVDTQGDASASGVASMRWQSTHFGFDMQTTPISAHSLHGEGLVSTPFEFSYDNTAEWGIGGELRFALEAQATTAVSAVPEPATGIAAIAGALVLAWAIRRRSRG